jgi:hypothetical protein
MDALAHLTVSRRLFLHAKAGRRRDRAFCAIRRATARTDHGDQQFAGVAIDRAVQLNRAKTGGRCLTSVAPISLVAFFSFIALLAGRALRSLRTLRASLPLRTRHALDALCALGSGRSLNARLTFRALRPRIPAAAAERQRDTNYE